MIGLQLKAIAHKGMQASGASALCLTILFLAMQAHGSDQILPAVALTALIACLSCAIWLWPTPPQRVSRLTGIDIHLVLAALLLLAVLFCTPAHFLSPPSPNSFFDPTAFTTSLLKFGGLICAFSIGIRLPILDKNNRKFLDFTILAGALWALVAIVGYLLDQNGTEGLAGFASGRLSGAFSSPNSAATLLGAFCVLSFGCLIRHFITKFAPMILERINLNYLTAFALSLTGLCLTLSRAALVITLICIAATALSLLWRRVPLHHLSLSAVGVLGLMTCVLGTPLMSILGRAETTASAVQVRSQIYDAHFTIAMQHVWSGVGFGSFNSINDSIINTNNYKALSSIGSAHNVYLQWLEESGVIGLWALVLLNMTFLIPMVDAIRQKSPYASRLKIILGAYAVFLLHGFTDYALQEPTLSVFVAMLLGYGYGLTLLSQKTPLILEGATEEVEA